MITGQILRDAMISAANSLGNQRQRVDSLNVFPVPDGDTGTNMSMTIGAAAQELLGMEDSAGVYEVAHTAAAALLRGARGNSGVITSLLFRGFSKGLKGKETAGAEDILAALKIGVDAAYKAVMKPTEGTMLTVARCSAEAAREQYILGMSVQELWDIVVREAAAALEQTPEMLPVLKKAGVVDAGGQGLLIIYQGMQSVFQGNGIVPSQEAGAGGEGSIHPDADVAGELDLADLTYPYCTEFIILKEDKNADILKLRAYLESIGDSAVVVDDEDIIKCHVHTADPGKAIQKALQFGMLNKIKIDNMWIQHDIKKKAATAKAQNKVAVDPDQPHGFVSVAAGDGVKQLFLDLGVHQVVSGGQTMNPSTDDILRAAEATPCQTVYVLPNNKNIIMAAEQAAKLCKSRDIKVIPTRTIPQGLSAMLAFDEGRDRTDHLCGPGQRLRRVQDQGRGTAGAGERQGLLYRAGPEEGRRQADQGAAEQGKFLRHRHLRRGYLRGAGRRVGDRHPGEAAGPGGPGLCQRRAAGVLSYHQRGVITPKGGTGRAASACRKSLFDKLKPAATAGSIRSLRSLDAKRGAFGPPFHTFSPS